MSDLDKFISKRDNITPGFKRKGETGLPLKD